MTHHGCSHLAAQEKYCAPGHTEDQPEDRFGRMFPHLPANYVPADLLEAIGDAAGPMSGETGTSDSVPVGHVIFGQFIDHDITLDVTSSLARNQNAGETPNLRTPTLDLDCIYGDGPEANPYLYAHGTNDKRIDGVRMLTGADHKDATDLQQRDLLRSANGRAMIGDPRNDENRIVSQMQLGMINFHNATRDEVVAERPGLEGAELFEEVRRRVTWHYQWCLVFDFLVAMCGQPVVDRVLADGRKLYCGVERPFIPVEFSVAAYRFGHSMVPQEIQVQTGGTKYSFFGPTLGGGFTALASDNAVVDWHELFDTPEERDVQRAERLDTTMAPVLLNLPFVDDGDPARRSLASRNLLRGNVFRLPSGEAAARYAAEQMVLDEGQIQTVTNRVSQLADEARTHVADAHGRDVSPLGDGSPLWLYLLAEAELIGKERADGVFEPGDGLGPLGARIVAEVMIGLLELDGHSFLGSNRNWKPEPGYGSIGEILASTQP